jgi:hypothetical protein
MPHPVRFSLTLRAWSIVLLALWVWGCTPSKPDADRDGVADREDRCLDTPERREVDAQGCCSAARAVRRGIDALLAESSFQVGDVWVLKQLLRSNEDARLEQLVRHWTEKLSPDQLARLINPSAQYVQLPENPGEGFHRFYTYVRAAIGRPESRAVRFITDFVTPEGQGYVLTHQFLVLEWAKEGGINLPHALIRARPLLLERIAAEQSENHHFSDLFAERTAILLHYAEPNREMAERWVDTLLEAQLADGAWQQAEPSRVTYDGQQVTAAHHRSHTTAWAVLALADFLRRY